MRDYTDSPITRRVTVTTLGIVVLSAAVAQAFGRFTYGIVLPDVRQDLLDGSNTLAGLLGTANTFAYLAGTLTVAWLGSRLPPVVLLRFGMVVSVAGIATAAIAPNGTILALALVLMGLGGAAIWIPSPGLAAAVVGVRKRGLAVGMMGSGVGVGVVFSGQLNNLVQHQGRSWRAVYATEAAIGLAVLILVWIVLQSRTRAHQSAGGFGGFSTLSKMEGWRPLTACYAVFGFGYLLVIAFFVTRLTDDSGFGSGEASAIFTIFGACTIVGGLTIGRVSDHFGRRRVLSAGYFAFSGSTLLLLTGEYPWVIVGAAGTGIFFAGMATVIAAYTVDRTDQSTYGPTYAALTFAFGVAQVMAPQVGGAMADWRGSFTAVFVLSAVVMASGGVIALALPKDHRTSQVL